MVEIFGKRASCFFARSTLALGGLFLFGMLIAGHSSAGAIYNCSAMAHSSLCINLVTQR